MAAMVLSFWITDVCLLLSPCFGCGARGRNIVVKSLSRLQPTADVAFVQVAL